MYTLSLKISGITCDACIKLIKKRIGRLVGVTDVKIEDYQGETTVVSEKEITSADITGVLANTSYQVS